MRHSGEQKKRCRMHRFKTTRINKLFEQNDVSNSEDAEQCHLTRYTDLNTHKFSLRTHRTGLYLFVTTTVQSSLNMFRLNESTTLNEYYSLNSSLKRCCIHRWMTSVRASHSPFYRQIDFFLNIFFLEK